MSHPDSGSASDTSCAACAICTEGRRPPSAPVGDAIQVPPTSDPSVTVPQVLRVARRLARENADLRSHSDFVRVLNAGLATHATVLHDRNLALLAQAREGYQIGLNTVRRLYDERDDLKADLLRVEEELETAKQTAFESGQWKVKFDVLAATTDEQTHALQDELARAQAEAASLAAQLASRPSASSESEALVQAYRERDAAARELQTTQDALATVTREADMLRASRGLLEADLRRVTALLTAHAEEHQRDLTHIRELEGSVSSAESARVVAEAAHSEAEVAVLRVESRASAYRDLLNDSRRHGREQLQALLGRAQHLQRRVTALDLDLSRVSREHADQVADWRRLLRRARTGRESALRVRNAMGARLAASVTQVGGTLDIDGLMRQLEREVEPAATAAVTVPTDPRADVSALDAADSPIPIRSASRLRPAGFRCGTSASGPSTPPRRSSVGRDSRSPSSSGSKARSDGRPSSSRGSRRTSSAIPSCVGASTQRRSRRPTTIADSAATASAAAAAATPSPVAHASTMIGKRKRRRRLVESSTESSPDERPPSKVLRPLHTGLTSSGDDGEDSSSSSSSSSEDTSDDESTKGVPSFRPVIPPLLYGSEWDEANSAPWPRSLVQFTLSTLDARTIRLTYLPPDPWFYPVVPPRAAVDWNANLMTLASVTALYETRPWSYLTELATPLTFASDDVAFQAFVARITKHLDHWAQAYWEASHDFELIGCNTSCDRWRRNRNSRRSRAGDHLASVLQLATDLFRRGLADLDLLLDPVFLHFPPSRSDRGRWYPGREHKTLTEALEAVDRREPWRRFYRSMPDAAGHCFVTSDHPAYSLARLSGKFVGQV